MWRDAESDDDFINFTDLADQVVTLVTDQALLPISIGIFGGWGTGKSTVLKLVEKRLPKEKPPLVIKFDAWLYQGFDDSRAALMEVVSTSLFEKAKGNETLVAKVKKFAARVNYFRALGTITDFGVGMALGIPPGMFTKASGAIGSILGGRGTEADLGDVKDTAKAAFTEAAGWLKPEEKRTPPKAIDEFRTEFADLLKELDTTLLVFIDNLDRCLPDVAIATLEAVRMFLFMPRTAFVIAADEGMIRHSVTKHFQDPNASHVRDYLDKLIQVPMPVPQVGVEDLRAYMYSLFVANTANHALANAQQVLLAALQDGWKDQTFTKEQICELCGNPADLLDKLAVADRLAPVLASAPNIQGNPRIVKRLMNAISVRQKLAHRRGMGVDLATLAKLAVFQRCTSEAATLLLYRHIMEGESTDDLIGPLEDERKNALPEEWKNHAEFIQKWREMDPPFKNVDLRPAVFLSRDVLAPARRQGGVGEESMKVFRAMLEVDSVTSQGGKNLIDKLSSLELGLLMTFLIDQMRTADWSRKVAGLHGAVVLARQHPTTAKELRSFLAGLPQTEMDKGMRFVVKKALESH